MESGKKFFERLIEVLHNGVPHTVEYVRDTLVPEVKEYFHNAIDESIIDVFDQTNPEEHTVLWLLGLERELQKESGVPFAELLPYLYRFFDRFNLDHMRVIEEEFYVLVQLVNLNTRATTTVADSLTNNASLYLLHVLTRLINRLEGISGSDDEKKNTPQRLLWPVHALAVEIAYRTKTYLLIKPIVYSKFDGGGSMHLTKDDIFLYHYYAGSILLDLKEYQLANENLSVALTVDHNKLKASCQNRSKLSSVFISGEGEPDPLTDDRRLEYGSFIHAFLSDVSYDEVKKEFQVHNEAFRANDDLHTALGGLERFKELKLLKLKRSFTSIDFGLMKDVDSSLTEEVVLKLAATGDLDAQIAVNEEDGRVELDFSQNSSNTTRQSESKIQKLEAELMEVIEFSQNTEKISRELVSNPKFTKGLKALDSASTFKRSKMRPGVRNTRDQFTGDEFNELHRRKTLDRALASGDLPQRFGDDDNANDDDDTDDEDASMEDAV